jgi:DNA-binding beta-propeller fold protein YncE
MKSRIIATLLAAALATSAFAQELPLVNAAIAAEFGAVTGDRLSMPTDMAVSGEGRVYIVDSGRHRIKIYDTAGNPLGSFATEGDGEGQLSGPVGIDVDSKGTIYVADKNNNRVQVFKADGSFQRSLPVGEAGAAAAPVDVAVDAKGKTLYVTTNDTHKVLAITSRGKFVSAWGGQGDDPAQFNYPATLTVDAAGNVLVVDALNARVQVFTEEGAPTAQYGKYGASAGSFIRPKGVAVDVGGRIYVSDSYLGVVQVFGADGSFVGVLGVDGEAVRFKAPTGLAFAAGRLYVTDMLAGKVLAYDMGGVQ